MLQVWWPETLAHVGSFGRRGTADAHETGASQTCGLPMLFYHPNQAEAAYRLCLRTEELRQRRRAMSRLWLMEQTATSAQTLPRHLERLSGRASERHLLRDRSRSCWQAYRWLGMECHLNRHGKCVLRSRMHSGRPTTIPVDDVLAVTNSSSSAPPKNAPKTSNHPDKDRFIAQ